MAPATELVRLRAEISAARGQYRRSTANRLSRRSCSQARARMPTRWERTGIRGRLGITAFIPMCTASQTATVAPAESAFPRYPAAWYLFGQTIEVDDRPVSKDLVGRRLVGFRAASGQVAILDAICAHSGGDLGKGRVVGD